MNGRVLSEECGHGEPGVCLGVGLTEAEAVVASVLLAVNSFGVLAYNKRLFDVTLEIGTPQSQTSSVIVSRYLLYTMIGILAFAVVRSPK